MNQNARAVNNAILIVEDAADLRNLYKLALRGRPYNLHLAASGEEALTLLQTYPDIRLVLLDMTLPGISGEQFLHQARALPDRGDLKIVLMSGKDNLAKSVESLGADGWLQKPIPLSELTSKIQSLLA